MNHWSENALKFIRVSHPSENALKFTHMSYPSEIHENLLLFFTKEYYRIVVAKIYTKNIFIGKYFNKKC